MKPWLIKLSSSLHYSQFAMSRVWSNLARKIVQQFSILFYPYCSTEFIILWKDQNHPHQRFFTSGSTLGRATMYHTLWRSQTNLCLQKLKPQMNTRKWSISRNGFLGWFPSLSLPMSLCSSSLCMSTIVPKTLSPALLGSLVVSPFSLSMRTLFWGLHHWREFLSKVCNV